MALKIIVTGATGLAGSEVVRQALLDDSIAQITAIVRRPLPIQHPKLKIVLHDNYRDYSPLTGIFASHDACLWCLGISQTQVSKEEYIKITYDYVVIAAQAMLSANPGITLVFLSGAGADSQEKSRTLFAHIKGKAENNLKRLPFKKLYIARPGGIIPVHKKENAAFFEKLLIPLYPLVQIFAPGLMISSVVLAKAMLHLAVRGADKIILENMPLKKLAGAA
ncbi:MAG TPA: NAD(P)H-binding protein [Fibrobacteria bacterium]|nr:NAD(P)H-binding protein [Fibrobacteria bacterium]